MFVGRTVNTAVCACGTTSLRCSPQPLPLGRAGDGLLAAQHMMQMGNNDHCPSRAGFALDMTDLFRMCASALSLILAAVCSSVYTCTTQAAYISVHDMPTGYLSCVRAVIWSIISVCEVSGSIQLCVCRLGLASWAANNSKTQ